MPEPNPSAQPPAPPTGPEMPPPDAEYAAAYSTDPIAPQLPPGPPPSSPAPPRDPNRRLHVFISYRREDSSGQAGRLYDSLSEHFGARNVFMDLDTIQPGEDFVEVIDEALKDCDCVLVVIGPRWLIAEREGARRLDDPADYLRIEVEHSLARASRVIPVLVQDAEMPGSRELPEAIKGLARRNAFELSDSRWRLDVGRLIDALEAIEIALGIREPSPEAVASPGIATLRGPGTAQQPQGVTGLPVAPISQGAPRPARPASGIGASLPPWVPPAVAARIVPIALLALFVVVALGGYVLAKGSPPATSLPGPSGLAFAGATPGVTAANTPTTAPTATAPPTLGATAAPSVAPTGAGASSAPQTASPPPGPTSEPSPARVLPPGIGLGAVATELDETFGTPGDFPVSSDDRGTLAYAANGFVITVVSQDFNLWSSHALSASHAVMEVRGSVTLSTAQSGGGLMCGNGTGGLLYGQVTGGNEWAIGSIVASTLRQIESGPMPPSVTVTPGAVMDVRLECAVTGAAADHMELVVNGVKVADNAAAPRIGPFDRGALLGASATVTPASAFFDNVTILSGESFREAPEALRGHVPQAWAANCLPSPENGMAGQVAVLICTPAGTINQAEYYQFDTQAEMTSQFEDFLRRNGPSATGTDCHTGPSTSRYNDGSGKDTGRLACYPNTGSMGGLIQIWTNESLKILSGGITETSTYDALATWWEAAGPLP